MPGVVLMGQALVVGASALKKVLFQMRKSHKLLPATHSLTEDSRAKHNELFHYQ